MDIRDLLELECAFECHRIVIAAAQVEEVACEGEWGRELADGIVLLEHFLHLARYLGELVAGLLEIILADGAECMSEGKGKHGEDCDLSCECLGRSNTNLRTDVDIDAGVGSSCNARADAIDDAKHQCSLFLGKLDGCKGVGCLARL